MGDMSSKETMDEEEESAHQLPHNQQTTSEHGNESVTQSEHVADFDTNSQGNSTNSSDNQDNSMEMAGEQEAELSGVETATSLYAEFGDSIEVFFSRAENAFSNSHNRFSLGFAKDWMLSVRDVGLRYTSRGCQESQLESIVMNRALTTVDRLVDAVQTTAEEEYDPLQTMTYIYCALAVFPCSVRLGTNKQGVVFHLSPGGSSSWPLLDTLSHYCVIKANCEEAEGQNGLEKTIHHQGVLMELGEWLEVDRAALTFLMVSKLMPVINNWISHMSPSPYFQNKFQVLRDMGLVLGASSHVRHDFLHEARVYHRLLDRVDTSRLPPSLVRRRQYVHARLLYHGREFAKALDCAQEALHGVTDAEERRETEALINKLTEELDKDATQGRHTRGPASAEWLQDTHAVQSQVDYHGLRQKHEAKMDTQRRKTKTVPVSKRGETPSQCPLCGNLHIATAPCPTTSPRQNPMYVPNLHASRHCRNSPHSTYHSPADQRPNSRTLYSVTESLSNYVDFDESEDEVDEEEEDYQFVDSPDEDEDNASPEQDESEQDRIEIVTPEKMEDEISTEQNWFEKSEEIIAKGEAIEDDGDHIELSEEQSSYFKKGGNGRGFYPKLHDDPGQLLDKDPKRYIRCQLKIQRAHKAIAKVLDKESKYTEILIDGRSKAGRTYMDDEVVVEILAKPGEVTGLQATKGASNAPGKTSVEKMAHGKVVGLIKRVHFANVEHPVLFCTLDEIESHLMKPLCKTVPKIHVLNDNVRKKYPSLVKNRIEIKTITPEGEIKFKGYCNVLPDKREQYVFRVVMLHWRQGNIYPLGAVLDAHISGKDYSGGLQVLSMQQRVPKCYPRAAVEDTKKIVAETVTKTGRQDLSAERQFTIDPRGSKDLDDAISVRTEGADVVIGVHIADVAAVVKKGSGLDLDARRRAVTFYPLDRKPHCMLPEPLSHGKCSLLPGKERLAFSVFFTFDQKGTQVADPEVRRTVINSRQQLTYEEVQRVIDGHNEGNVELAIQEDIRQIHTITCKLREDRLNQSMLFVPFKDPRLTDLENTNDCVDSHALIEELMILTNACIANYLTKRPQYHDSMIVCCHKAPTYEDLVEWREKEGNATNLVMQLQGKQITPDQKLSLDNQPRVEVYSSQPQVVVHRQVWEKLCQHLKDGQVEEARRLAFMDSLHPLQCLASHSWMDLMETAQYMCAYGLNLPDLRHFGLSLSVYTHFTSPIRRYADLHVQRLLHAALDCRSPDCGPDEVTKLCLSINSATFRQKAFGKGCMALKLADSLQRQPLGFRTYVDRVDDDQLTVLVPSLNKFPDRQQDIPFSTLGVSHQPELVIDTALKKASVTVQWNRRYYHYHFEGSFPQTLLSVWQHLEKSQNEPARSAVVIDIHPDHLSESVQHKDWVHILKKLVSSNPSGWKAAPEPISKERSKVEYISSDKGDVTSIIPVHFRRVYTRGQIVLIQLSAEPKKGILKPRVEIVHIARNASVCTQHVCDPVSTLSRVATRSTRDQQFTSYKEYVKAWMPLLEMEAATNAGSMEGSVVIDNVTVTLKHQTSSNNTGLYRGSFILPALYCSNRNIQFGWQVVDNIQKENKEYRSDYSFPLDYLCLRYQTECSSAVVSRIKQSEAPDTVDRHYTWLAHASVVKVQHKHGKDEDGGNVVVIFVLSDSSPPPPPQLMTERGDKISLEILRKTDVDRRSQEMLLQLENPDCQLGQAIAFGSHIPRLDADHKRLGRKDENHEVYIEEGVASRPLIRNNTTQLAAIQMAMTNSLAIIQGPPGTGKTNMGIKLVYLYSKINRELQEAGKGRKTVLYCGPSNKSVDLVARELDKKLGVKCPKMVRMYGSTIESKDYPVLLRDVRSIRGPRDLKSDPSLQNVTLHHLIREEGKPYAEKIATFEKYFQMCQEQLEALNVTNVEKNHSEPRQHNMINFKKQRGQKGKVHSETENKESQEKSKLYSMVNENMKKYLQLLNKASIEELKHYEVVLCTCATAGGGRFIAGAEGSVFQVIIDECAMSQESQSLIPIIASNAQQVVLIGDHKQLRPIIKCQAAAELGLDQSLFERLFKKFWRCTTFLNKQYRMDPEICAFPGREFYEGKLETGYSHLWAEGLLLRFWPKYPGTNKQIPHLLVDVRGEEETLTVTTEEGNQRSKSNKKEADKVIEILTFLKKMRVDLQNVKLLTQYNAQRHLLETKLKTAIEQNVEHVFDHYDLGKINVSTVVSSQGGEWEYVILSTVRSLPSYRIEPNPTLGWCRQNMGSITDRNQVNVALTRARKGLIIVGNAELLKCDQVWNHLFNRYDKLGCYFKDPDDFPPKGAKRWTKKLRQRNATSDWQDVPRHLPPAQEG
ncbi:hypothetical protein ACOMHN_051312 [Nucella lapillus]